MEHLYAIQITLEKLTEILCSPENQKLFLTFKAPDENTTWKCLSKKRNCNGWILECQIRPDTKPVCILHTGKLTPVDIFVDVKNAVHLLSLNPNQNEIYLLEEQTTNFQDVKKLLEVYHPEVRGFVSAKEEALIIRTLHLDQRDILDLRNLRDFVVLFLSKGDIPDGHGCSTQEQEMENMDKMSAITCIIDHKIWSLGGKC